jgi:hypothetical protein
MRISTRYQLTMFSEVFRGLILTTHLPIITLDCFYELIAQWWMFTVLILLVSRSIALRANDVEEGRHGLRKMMLMKEDGRKIDARTCDKDATRQRLGKAREDVSLIYDERVLT